MGYLNEIKKLLENKGFKFVVLNPIYTKDWNGPVKTDFEEISILHISLGQIQILSLKQGFSFEIKTLEKDVFFSKQFEKFDELKTFVENFDLKEMKLLEKEFSQKRKAVIDLEKKWADEKAEKEAKKLSEKEKAKKEFLAGLNMTYLIKEDKYSMTYETDEGGEGKIVFQYKEKYVDAPFGMVTFESVDELKDFRREVRKFLL